MSNGYTEKNNYTKRLSRYTSVGKEFGKFTTKFLFNTIISDNKNERNALALKNALGSLKGPLMKIAQLLSTIPGAVPAEYANELSQLQSMAPPMGKGFVRRRMISELGVDWNDCFKDFDYSPFAAASLGQVHKAVTNESREIVCKLQYPDMNSAVEADLKQLDVIFKINKNLGPAIGTDQIRKEIAERLREELDYKREGTHMKLFGEILKDYNDIKIPELVDDLCTEKLLVMTYLPGEPLMNFKNSSQSVRNKIAKCLFRAWWIPFGQYGVIHGDPHLGNYSIIKRKNEILGINLLDFGCVRFFQPSFVKGVIDLYFALMKNNKELAVSAYESWGFENISKDLIEILNIWAKFLFSPLLEDKVMKMQETNSTAYGAEAASKVHKELKKIGGVKPPREFVFMDRAAIGLGSVFLHLGAELNWYKIFNELIHNFDEKEVENKQNKLLSEAKLKENL